MKRTIDRTQIGFSVIPEEAVMESHTIAPRRIIHIDVA